MDQSLQTYINDIYNFSDKASYSLLHAGENQTYLVTMDENKFVLREYRPNRYRLEEIEAEVEWLEALKKEILVPSVLKNIHNERVTVFNSTFFVMSQFIEGSSIEDDSAKASDYEKLGAMMRRFHEASQQVANHVSEEWKGWKRPKYDVTSIIDQPLVQLLNAPFLSLEHKKQFEKIAGYLKNYIRNWDFPRNQFIHADLHFGNIIASKNDWYYLDFDESGFGHKAFDIGVPRLHMIATGDLEEMWPSFARGYGIDLTEKEVRIGACLRIFYMAGKIPLRMDIEVIGKDPNKFLTRYLGFINMELSGLK